MVGVVLVLGASVVIERVKVPMDCFQTSISAYYYTPVHSIFIGALVTLGVCLICLRGNTDREDRLLNVAGMLAPIVAFVPTPGYLPWCISVPAPIGNVSADVANNVVALLIVSGVALLIVGGVLLFAAATLPARIGWVAGVLLWAGTLGVFLLNRDAFLDNAHAVAAGSLFVCIVLASVDNAFDTMCGRLGWLYFGLALAMGAALVIIAGIGVVTSWPYWRMLVEPVVLTLFIAFWLTQTWELWDGGIRPRSHEKGALLPSTRLLPRSKT